MRLLQAHGELPAFACAHFQRVVAVTVKSCELDMARDMYSFCLYAIHIKSKTQAALMQTGHLCHDAGDYDVLSLPFVR